MDAYGHRYEIGGEAFDDFVEYLMALDDEYLEFLKKKLTKGN